MNLPPAKPTAKELKFLRENSPHMTAKELGSALGRGHMVIRRWMTDYNIPFKERSRPRARPRPKLASLGWDKGLHLQDIWR